jgi:type IV secretory pathway VirB10-like protein
MNDDYEIEDEPVHDPGGVPAALSTRAAVPGYRGMSRLVGTAALALVVLIGAFGVWSLSHRSSASAAAAQTLAFAPASTDTSMPVPDPTLTPLALTATKRPVLAPPTLAATVQPLPAAVPEQEQQNAPSAAAPAAVAPSKSPAQIDTEQRAQLVDAAAHSSGRMALAAPDDARAQGASISAGAASGPIASRVGSAEEAPHGSFLGQRSSAVGYEAPTSAYEINETTKISCRLVTTIDSTLPGAFQAQVTTPVYDSRTHQVVVIPAGAILVGQYDSQTIAGEARLLSYVTRILFPNGTKFEMGSNEAAGAKGEAGLPGVVDTHSGRAFGNAALYSMLDAAGNLISSSINRNREVISVNTATQAVQPAKQAAPTLHLYSGSSFVVLVSRDLPLDEYRAQ